MNASTALQRACTGPLIRAMARMLRRMRAAAVVGALMLLTQSPGVYASTIHFLVAEPPGRQFHFDSYVLPLTQPADIAHARDLIAFGPSIGAPIVVAEIEAGADGINRDYLAPGNPAWSWHVSDFIGFADAGIEILDGWPGFVESDVQGWIRNTGGAIGFWSYTVVAELSVPAPGTLLLILLGSATALALRPSILAQAFPQASVPDPRTSSR